MSLHYKRYTYLRGMYVRETTSGRKQPARRDDSRRTAILAVNQQRGVPRPRIVGGHRAGLNEFLNLILAGCSPTTLYDIRRQNKHDR